ncbi:hypothetical protein CTAYLR_003450 [Chrysophaeum taylorii]|uniref:NAD(P)H-hydrate epimerase n=1 Tax=Chrysophaeum taylorii TaxID=2483200 RepID=A0AAD7UAL2_9STRA|nr:hypothetical protein CTAYLR_003450 [Chrysophaeum taylorii]
MKALGVCLRLLSQAEAVAVDEALFQHFSVDSLMELAGLSVAEAIATHYEEASKVLCVCGPGNNGGDGLVAARHLKEFGFEPEVVYPKRSAKPLFQNLESQMREMRIPVRDNLPPDLGEFDVVVDAIFGFSFTPPVRPPFDSILRDLVESKVPVVSVDIPSGWHVEDGPPTSGLSLAPAVLVSLTAPKKCAAKFEGPHYLGGRFVPPTIFEAFGFSQPPFPKTSQVVRLA